MNDIYVVFSLEGGIPYPVIATTDKDEANKQFISLVEEFKLSEAPNPTTARWATNDNMDIEARMWCFEEAR